MSKSSLKLKYFEILNLNSYYQQAGDDILNDEEDIIDIVFETSKESKFTFNFLVILSKGTLFYLEYNTTNKKLTKMFKNNVFNSIITNDILKCELSFSSPILMATGLNEIIVIDTKQKPCETINITEENMIIYSSYVQNYIVDLKFNCNQTTILAITANQILVYKINYDKYEQKHILQCMSEIFLYGLPKEIDYSNFYNNRIFPKFSDLNDDILYISYITENQLIDNSIRVSLENEENFENIFYYLNIAKLNLSKKEFTMKILVIYIK